MTTDLEHAMHMLNPNTYTHIDDETIQNLLPTEVPMDDYILLIESIRKLSKDAIDVIEFIMNPPTEFSSQLAMKNSTKLTLGKITEYLRGHDPKRWKHKTIKTAFDEIKKVLEC